MTWETLFERATAYDVSDDDVRAAIDAVRAANEHEGDGDDHHEADD